MNNENLIEHLRSSWKLLEAPTEGNDEKSKILNYLYFATLVERNSIHVTENLEGYSFRDLCGLSQIQKNQIDILILKPYFEKALAKKQITSIALFGFPKTFDRATAVVKVKFLNELENIEKSRGILNALLTLRNWAFFPDESKGSKNRSRLAKSYIGVVLNRFRSIFTNDEQIISFLKWCGKITRKILPWGFKKNDLRSPPKSALPIYMDEAANYVRHFLLCCNSQNTLGQHFAEMTIFLSLCLACARQHSNYFDPTDVLKVSKSDIDDIQEIPNEAFIHSVKNIKEKSRPSKGSSAHEVLLLGISPDFLLDNTLWPDYSQTPHGESKDSNQFCKRVKVKDRLVLISQPLAQAIEMMDKFTITYKDVENRLKEAYEIVGLLQSSGGISPRCFLFNPHSWEGVDTRKNWKSRETKFA